LNFSKKIGKIRIHYKFSETDKMKILTTIFIAFALIFLPTLTKAQTDITDDEATSTEDTGTSTDEDEATSTDEDEVEDETDEEPMSDADGEIEIDSDTIEGEVVEITDTYVVIETVTGDRERITISSGGLLAAYVTPAVLGELNVGDEVSLGIATSATVEAAVVEVNDQGALVVTTENGETVTVTENQEGVTIRSNGVVVTDFSILSPDDEVEITFEDTVITEVEAGEAEDGGTAGWLVPLIIILALIALGAAVAKRAARE
jgi:hypothetical protein